MEENIIHKEKCEKENIICEEIKIECESKKNKSVEVIEADKECLQRFEQSSELVEGLTTQGVTKSTPCDHEEYMHHEEEKLEVCAQKKKLEIDSIMKVKELMIHHDYTNNFNLSFSSVFKVMYKILCHIKIHLMILLKYLIPMRSKMQISFLA